MQVLNAKGLQLRINPPHRYPDLASLLLPTLHILADLPNSGGHDHSKHQSCKFVLRILRQAKGGSGV